MTNPSALNASPGKLATRRLDAVEARLAALEAQREPDARDDVQYPMRELLGEMAGAARQVLELAPTIGPRGEGSRFDVAMQRLRRAVAEYDA